MRDTRGWKKELCKELGREWPDSAGVSPQALCEVELGLYFWSAVAPGSPSSGLWAVLTGYWPALAELESWDPQHRRMLALARHLLAPFKSRHDWLHALERYQNLPERLRLYHLDEADIPQATTFAVNTTARSATYETALTTPLAYVRSRLKVAEPGRYWCAQDGARVDVSIPEDAVAAAAAIPQANHGCKPRGERKPIEVSWAELLETARWIDEREESHRHERWLRDAQLTTPGGAGGEMKEGIRIDGRAHLVGMVGSGKSTLMFLLSVWAARQGKRVTLVLGDVVNQLDIANRLVQLGIKAAPVLGNSSRGEHLRRLHQAVAAQGLDLSAAADHAGFRWTSPVCLLDAVSNSPRPFPPGEQPCLSLRTASAKAASAPAAADRSANFGEPDAGNNEQRGGARGCPLFPACPYHAGQRDLVEAEVWCVTPASLVYCRPSPLLNAESIRFAELAYLHSDLVIVDEVDRVQGALDLAFCPNQDLVSPGADSWLNALDLNVTTELTRAGRVQLKSQETAEWCRLHRAAQSATDHIWQWLLQDPSLARWLGRDYFTEWTLLERLACELTDIRYSTPLDQKRLNPRYLDLMKAFEAYVDTPNSAGPLSAAADSSLAQSTDAGARGILIAWLHAQEGVSIPPEKEEEIVSRLLLSLTVGVLANRLDHLVRRWKHAETVLRLEDGGELLAHRPPADYTPLLPEAPMGNVLGFQYLPAAHDGQSGILRFFRWAGLGRWLLLHLHDLLSDEGVPGPNVLLLSGTSWAPGSHHYHLPVPVDQILSAPAEELSRIDRAKFHFMPFPDEKGQPIRVSGSHPEHRMHALQGILRRLAAPADGERSVLEEQCSRLDPEQQRILLVVNSYEEAVESRKYLLRVRPDWNGQVLNLRPDDKAMTAEWETGESPDLPRGMVGQFARRDAWILVAPLLAIERGHNIVTPDGKAVIGAAFFLVRPHPRPDEIDHAIHGISSWAAAVQARHPGPPCRRRGGSASLDHAAHALRRKAAKRWRKLLWLPWIYRTLKRGERRAIVWDAAVSIWQVIGRLVRGGSSPAVFFCDSAFAIRTAEGAPDEETGATSLLLGIREELHRYFKTKDSRRSADAAIAEALFGPFYRALEKMEGLKK